MNKICKKVIDCFNYYDFNPKNRVAEVIAYGNICGEDKKCCTDKLEIVREVSWNELLEIVNTGNGCTGFRNSGNCNSGNYNSGDYNSGNYNSGDWNKCCFSNGCFNTMSPKIYMFNKPSEWTYEDWINSKAFKLLYQLSEYMCKYIHFSNMTDEENTAHPEAETTDGYLKERSVFECCDEWWRNLTHEDKQIIKSIPNFDAKIFKEIIGIDVDMG